MFQIRIVESYDLDRMEANHTAIEHTAKLALARGCGVSVTYDELGYASAFVDATVPSGVIHYYPKGLG